MLSDRDLRSLIESCGIGIWPPVPDGAVQPASIDLRLANQFRTFKAVGAIDTRCPQDDLTELVNVPDGESFTLHPGEFVLASTVEAVRLGAFHVGMLEGRSSLGRLGLMVHSTAGLIDPGFRGQITLELSNVNAVPLLLWPGERVAQLCVFRLPSGADHPYGTDGVGRYQGQRGPTPSLGAGPC